MAAAGSIADTKHKKVRRRPTKSVHGHVMWRKTVRSYDSYRCELVYYSIHIFRAECESNNNYNYDVVARATATIHTHTGGKTQSGLVELRGVMGW